jgi:hypothetical protein
MMGDERFDSEEPPEEPPKGTDPLVWRLAWTVWMEHQIDVTGFCRARTCRDVWAPWPCDRSGLGTAGLEAASGNQARWINLNRGRWP